MRGKISLKELQKKKNQNYKKSLGYRDLKPKQESKNCQSKLYYIFSSQAIEVRKFQMKNGIKI